MKRDLLIICCIAVFALSVTSCKDNISEREIIRTAAVTSLFRVYTKESVKRAKTKGRYLYIDSLLTYRDFYLTDYDYGIFDSSHLPIAKWPLLIDTSKIMIPDSVNDVVRYIPDNYDFENDTNSVCYFSPVMPTIYPDTFFWKQLHIFSIVDEDIHMRMYTNEFLIGTVNDMGEFVEARRWHKGWGDPEYGFGRSPSLTGFGARMRKELNIELTNSQ